MCSGKTSLSRPVRSTGAPARHREGPVSGGAMDGMPRLDQEIANAVFVIERDCGAGLDSDGVRSCDRLGQMFIQSGEPRARTPIIEQPSFMRMWTCRLSPTTMRTISDAASRTGMKSSNCTLPSTVAIRVSRTRVSGRYRRSVRRTGCRGVILQHPEPSLPNRAARQASESKRGQQSQSMLPCEETSAAVSQSPMRA
jgi:hypothetical protein